MFIINSTKKQPHAVALMMRWRCPDFPDCFQSSIFGDENLNFRVRYVDGWNLLSMVTITGIIIVVFTRIIYKNLKEGLLAPSQLHIYNILKGQF